MKASNPTTPPQPKPDARFYGEEQARKANAQTAEQRLGIATHAMTAMLLAGDGLESLMDEADRLNVNVNVMLAWQAFTAADAMMAEAARSPEARAAQLDAWMRALKGGAA